MWPSRYDANQNKNQDNQKNSANTHLIFLSRRVACQRLTAMNWGTDEAHKAVPLKHAPVAIVWR
jgi:hypothetical protein